MCKQFCMCFFKKPRGLVSGFVVGWYYSHVQKTATKNRNLWHGFLNGRHLVFCSFFFFVLFLSNLLSLLPRCQERVAFSLWHLNNTRALRGEETSQTCERRRSEYKQQQVNVVYVHMIWLPYSLRHTALNDNANTFKKKKKTCKLFFCKFLFVVGWWINKRCVGKLCM